MKVSFLKKSALMLAAFATLSAPAVAQTTVSGPSSTGLTNIQSVMAYQSGSVLFVISAWGTGSARTTCNVNRAFTVNTSSTSGQAIYDVIIRAQQGGKGVYVIGTGTCSSPMSAEGVNWIEILP